MKKEIEKKVMEIVADKVISQTFSDLKRAQGEIKLTDALGRSWEDTCKDKECLEVDSLDNVVVIMETEKAFDISISDEQAEKIVTVQDLVNTVKSLIKKERISREEVLLAISVYLYEERYYPAGEVIDETTSLEHVDKMDKALLAAHLEDAFPLLLPSLPEDCTKRFNTVGEVIDEVMATVG